MRLITVVMNEPDSATRNSETTVMLNYGFNMYSINNIISTNTVLKKVKVSLGKSEYVEVVPSEDVNILNNKTKEERDVTYKVELDKLVAPIKKGDVVGKLIVLEDNEEIMSINMTVKNNVKKANIFIVFYRNIKSILTGNII